MSERIVEVHADWDGLGGPTLMGVLAARLIRGNEVFSFEYDRDWLTRSNRSQLDPTLQLFSGPQYESGGQNFGVFLDSSPDRWGRVLMKRREALSARKEDRTERSLRESDYLLGVHDGTRMGALRFKVDERFLDDSVHLAAPPIASLRELEAASLRLEQQGVEEEPEYSHWLQLLMAPGSSLGGARPKANVTDTEGNLWIAKFPAGRDEDDIGAWEKVVHTLARRSGITVPEARAVRFGSRHHTFLSRRFDRTEVGTRLHFASAMTLLERRESDDKGVASYLELAGFLSQQGAQVAADLEQLWRRIVFFVCVSNTDDHLRNHGFLLGDNGWALSPSYDMNANPDGNGLNLNISETDNAQELELVLNNREHFRVPTDRAQIIVEEVVMSVNKWRQVAAAAGISRSSQERFRRAFRVADA